MAYVTNQDESQIQPASSPGMATNQPAPQTSSGGSSGATFGGPQGVSAITSQTKAPPVQNLQAYLSANAPQAVAAGQNIASGLDQTSGKVTGDINTDQSAFDQSVQAQNINPNAGLVGQAAANPNAFVQDPNNVTGFIQQRDAAYTGPQTYQESGNYQGLKNEVSNAVAGAPDINQPGGIRQLVTGQEVNPTTGKENLDTLILQQNNDALSPIRDALARFPKLNDYLTNAATTENANIQGAITNDAASQKGVQDAFYNNPDAVVPTFAKTINDQFENAQNSVSTANSNINANNTNLAPLEAAYQQYLASGGAGAGDIIAPLQGQQTFGMPDISQTASKGQYDEQLALEQLLGGGYTNKPLDDTQASKAGTFSAPEVSLADTQGLGRDLATQNVGATYNSQVSPKIQSLVDILNNTVPGRTSGTPSTTLVPGSPALNEQKAALSQLGTARGDLGKTSPLSQSQIIGNAGIPDLPNSFHDLNVPGGGAAYQHFDPHAIESLLQYLQGVTGSGYITSTAGDPSKYQVNA